jgi:DNA adenine methylase
LAEIRCGDFAETLESAGPGDFAYLDPPYVPRSTTASFTAYTRDGFGEQEHRRLAETMRDLTKRGCRVLLTNSDTALVRKLYAGFEIETVYATRAINSKTSGRGKITELTIRNYRLT